MNPGLILNSMQMRHELELVCDAALIPDDIQISLKGLEVGDSIHISHVTLPAGARSAITDRDFTIATVIASQAVITGAYSLTRQAIQLGLGAPGEERMAGQHLLPEGLRNLRPLPPASPPAEHGSVQVDPREAAIGLQPQGEAVVVGAQGTAAMTDQHQPADLAHGLGEVVVERLGRGDELDRTPVAQAQVDGERTLAAARAAHQEGAHQ